MKTDKAVNTKHTPESYGLAARYSDDGTMSVAIYSSAKSAPLVVVPASVVIAAPETAAERDRLNEVNAELLDALKNAVKVLERKAPDSLDLIEARAAIIRAEGGK